MDSNKYCRKIRLGMIGGSPDTFIGSAHHMAISLDGLYEIVCGTFSSNVIKSKDIGEKLFLNPLRVYSNWEELLEKESKKEKEERIDAISIVTPNHLHFAPTKKALELGFHVILDKPLCLSTEEAYELEKTIKSTGLLFALTHTYTGYPMIKEARQIVKEGRLGKIRKVVVDYPQGWLTTRLEVLGNKNAQNRQDPKITGSSCTLGDVGTHAENMLEYITGQKIKEVCAEVSIMVEGRLLDDDSSVLLRLDNGAKGVLLASQVLTGEENQLSIRVWGEKGGLEWNHKDNNSLKLKWAEKPEEILRTGTNYSYLTKNGIAHSRFPGGHPEGYLEAFGNIYRNFGYAILERIENRNYDKDIYDYPSIEDGIRGMLFIEKVLESGKSDKKWVSY